MTGRAAIPIAVAGVVVAVGAVFGGIFLFAGDGREPDSGQAVGPAPTTQLSQPDPGPSGGEPPPVPGDPFPPVPSGQVEGDLYPSARAEGRHVYIPVADTTCWRDQVWPRGEYADRVEVEIRLLPPATYTTPVAVHSPCVRSAGKDDMYAVIELAEPLGDRRLVVTHVNGAQRTP